MQNRHGMIALPQQVADAVGAVLGPAKDNDGIIVHALQQLAEQVALLVLGHRIDDVLDGFRRRPAYADLDRLRTAHRPFDEGIDFGRDRGGKERGVPVARTFFHNPPHVGQETHVEHPIRFVEHEVLDLVEPAVALLQMVEQAARGGNQDINTLPQRVLLPAITHAPINHRHAQAGKPRQVADRRLHLRGQFPRWFEDQHARRFAVLAQLRKDRQGKRGGLARPGLRAANDILSGENQRNDAKLNRCRLDVTHRFDAFKNRRGQAQFRKRHGAG